MNRIALAIPVFISTGIGAAVNFFIIRALLRKFHKPEAAQQQTRLAVILAVVLSLPSILRIRQLEELGDAQPLKR